MTPHERYLVRHGERRSVEIMRDRGMSYRGIADFMGAPRGYVEDLIKEIREAKARAKQ